ncbi:hypothetical protein [Ruthenibacterium lactatiformans]|jgi:hypothetical protein|uniref:hypothetical protein n=1 Tax=Ruthenibacterium lactatiformans TaxID=1550024 RepID=UPI002942ABC4|nr:hypothetical protein [Ruthenibacterium lactatiformans]
MIKFEHTEVVGWEHAIRGMRNPMNSWEKSDSGWTRVSHEEAVDIYNDDSIEIIDECDRDEEGLSFYIIGKNDRDLMMQLRNAGTDHRKFMRMITVYVDITAPLYWWKEFDTYKVGTVANSCSTMHKIHAKEFALEDFSHEHLHGPGRCNLEDTIKLLNYYRDCYNGTVVDNRRDGQNGETVQKVFWWQIIQLLPSSYNQRRTVMLNYEVLANIYKSRQNHRLDEWCEHEEMVYKNYMDDVERESIEGQFSFCDWIESLPYSELITGPDLKATYSMKGVNNMSIEMDLKKVDEVEKVKMDTYAVTPRNKE